MTQKTIDDELEVTTTIGKGEIWAACLCLWLSLLCGLTWLCLLIAPHML